MVPRIGDGEVGELLPKSILKVVEAMRNDEFKLSCNMIFLASFIRHGHINTGNEPV